MRRRGKTTRIPAQIGDTLTVDMEKGKVYINGILFTKPVFCQSALQTAINCCARDSGKITEIPNPKGLRGISYKREPLR